MKKIHLIRHAKSSWEDASLDDIDRPLNQRGKDTCRFMAPLIYNAGCSFDAVFCSPAVRAQSTIKLISNAATRSATAMLRIYQLAATLSFGQEKNVSGMKYLRCLLN